MYLNGEGMIRPHFSNDSYSLFGGIMFPSLVVSVQNISLLFCFPYQDKANHLALLFVSKWKQISSFSRSTADKDLSSTVEFDKVFFCWVGNGVDINLFPKLCVKGVVWELLYQLLLDNVLFYNALKRTVWYCVHVKQSKESGDTYCVHLRPPSLEFWGHKLNTCQVHNVDVFFSTSHQCQLWWHFFQVTFHILKVPNL